MPPGTGRGTVGTRNPGCPGNVLYLLSYGRSRSLARRESNPRPRDYQSKERTPSPPSGILHHTGEQSKPETRVSPETCSARLSYRRSRSHARRDSNPRHVVPNEVTDLFTTGVAFWMPGNRRKRDMVRQTQGLAARNPRRDALRGGTSTVRIRTNSPWGCRWSEVSALFTTGKGLIRGTDGAAFCWQTKKSAPSPPDISKTLLSFPLKISGRAGNKNPSGALAREGSGNEPFRNA